MADRFADVMQKERERLHREREQVSNQQQELEDKLAQVWSLPWGRIARCSEAIQRAFLWGSPVIEWEPSISGRTEFAAPIGIKVAR